MPGMDNKAPDRQEYEALLDMFARQVNAVDVKLAAIRHKDYSPLDLDVKGYIPYERDESLIGRVIIDRAQREKDMNLRRVDICLERLHLVTDHFETLVALEKKAPSGEGYAEIVENMQHDYNTFDALLDQYLSLMNEGGVQDALESVERYIVSDDVDTISLAFQNAASGNVLDELKARRPEELIKDAADKVAAFANSIVKDHVHRLVDFSRTMNSHLLLYRRQDDGGAISAKGLNDDYNKLADRGIEVIDACRVAHVRSMQMVNDAFAMKESVKFRSIALVIP